MMSDTLFSVKKLTQPNARFDDTLLGQREDNIKSMAGTLPALWDTQTQVQSIISLRLVPLANVCLCLFVPPLLRLHHFNESRREEHYHIFNGTAPQASKI